MPGLFTTEGELMSQHQPANYLESKVRTASTAQLHLMLIEGAVRFCTKAQQELASNNEARANEAMVRGIDIVAELLAGVRGGEGDISTKLADLYLFLFHTLTSAYVNTDATKLADVLRILEFERETWQLACQRAHGDAPQQPPAAPPAVVAPSIAPATPGAGFSLEA